MPLKGSPSHFQVSVKKSAPRDSTLPQEPTLDKNSNQDEPRRTTEVWAQFGPLFLFAPLLPKILKSKIFAFGFAATAHRRGIPDDHGGVLHPCRESHGRGRGSGEGLRDRQHRLQAGAERPQGLARNVHPECKRSASPARYLPSPRWSEPGIPAANLDKRRLLFICCQCANGIMSNGSRIVQ